MDLKYDILKHPNVQYTTDGKAKPYIHGRTDRAKASIMINEDMYEIKFNDIQDIEGIEEMIEDYELLTEEEIEKRIVEGGL